MKEGKWIGHKIRNNEWIKDGDIEIKTGRGRPTTFIYETDHRKYRKTHLQRIESSCNLLERMDLIEVIEPIYKD